MTTIYEEEVTCAVCGAKQTEQEMGSTSSFGPMDLDTRPPPLQRGTMEMRVHVCARRAWAFCYPMPKTRSEHRYAPLHAPLRTGRDIPFPAFVAVRLTRVCSHSPRRFATWLRVPASLVYRPRHPCLSVRCIQLTPPRDGL